MKEVYIIIPVYKGFAETKICVESVIKYSEKFKILIINDASPLVEFKEYFDDTINKHANMFLIENEENFGYVRSVNIGFEFDKQKDVILLNSDTCVTNGWVEKLQSMAYSSDNIATVTPMSNAATICSYPVICKHNDLYKGFSVDQINSFFEEIYFQDEDNTVEIPTGVGFCLYIKRKYLEQIGGYDDVLFKRGYGEENDFCMMCLKIGGRHLVAVNTFIYHKEGVSFDAEEKKERLQQALEDINRLYPDYNEKIDQFIKSDPLWIFRRRVDLLRLNRFYQKSIVLVTHKFGGGIAKHIDDLSGLLADHTLKIFILKPNDTQGVCLISSDEEEFSIVLNSKEWLTDLVELLKYLYVVHIHFHHIGGYSNDIYRLAQAAELTYDVTLHDYFMFCPNWSGFIEEKNQFCGFDPHFNCQGCITKYGKLFFSNDIPVIDLFRKDNLSFLKSARKVITPSYASKEYFNTYFPTIDIDIHPHPEYNSFKSIPEINNQDKVLNVAFIGALAQKKGSKIVKQCVDQSRKESLAIRWILIGYHDLQPTILNQEENFIITGSYDYNELPELFIKYNIDIVVIPALWPETFSYVLSETMFMGRPVIVPDIGAFRERVEESEAGLILPHPITANAILDELKKIIIDRSILNKYRENALKYKGNNPENYYDQVYKSLGNLLDQQNFIYGKWEKIINLKDVFAKFGLGYFQKNKNIQVESLRNDHKPVVSKGILGMLKTRMVIFAAQAGDELLGAGGFMALSLKFTQCYLKVIIVGGDKTKLDIEKVYSGLSVLGIGKENVEFWPYQTQSIPLSGNIIGDYRRVMIDLRPNIVLLPSPNDADDTRRRVTRGFIKAIEGKITIETKLHFYEVDSPQQINHIENISETFFLKQKATICYKHIFSEYNYLRHAETLAMFRGSVANCRYGEGFLVFPWNGSRENFFEQRPLISVLVRSDDQLLLNHALESLVHQTYTQIEVIIVWFSDTALILRDEFNYLDVKIIQGVKGSRGANLNLGFSIVILPSIAFLDEDDIVLPEHYEGLLEFLHAERHIDIAYCGASLVQCVRGNDSIQRIKEEMVYNEEYEPSLLLLENYIPLNTLLIRRQVFKAVSFDEDLIAYEDWYFLLCAQFSGFSFGHIDNVTAEYRYFDQDIKTSHIRKEYHITSIAVYQKILQKITPEHLNQLNLLRVEMRKNLSDQSLQLSQHHQDIENLQSRVKELENVKTRFNYLEKRLLELPKKIGIVSNDLDTIISTLAAYSLKVKPIFSIVMAVHNPPPEILIEALQSIQAQIYPYWELCIVDDASSSIEVKQIIEDIFIILNEEGKIKYKRFDDNIGISEAINQAAALATGEYLALMDHDDWLYPDALCATALALSDTNYKFIYTDSQTIDPDGKPLYYHNKPDWSPETLLFWNYINHLSIIEHSLWKKLGGMRSILNGVQDWDLCLRIAAEVSEKDVHHIKQQLYGWRAIQDSVAFSIEAKPWIKDKCLDILQEYHSRFHAKAQKKDNVILDIQARPNGVGFIIRPQTHISPSIHIFIIAKDDTNSLYNCLKSLTLSNYPCKEITIIDNSSEYKLKKILLNRFQKEGISICYEPNAEDNWSLLNNIAETKSTADIYMFLNPEIIFSSPDSIQTIVNQFSFENIGIIGALLLKTNNTIYHNGFVVDPDHIAYAIQTSGDCNELIVTRNVSAVSGECMVVRREIFREIGGFDESLPNYFSDVDFCLAAQKRGWRTLLSADTNAIVSYEKKQRNPEASEIEYMRDKWNDYLIEKYYYRWNKLTKTIQFNIK